MEKGKDEADKRERGRGRKKHIEYLWPCLKEMRWSRNQRLKVPLHNAKQSLTNRKSETNKQYQMHIRTEASKRRGAKKRKKRRWGEDKKGKEKGRRDERNKREGRVGKTEQTDLCHVLLSLTCATLLCM